MITTLEQALKSLRDHRLVMQSVPEPDDVEIKKLTRAIRQLADMIPKTGGEKFQELQEAFALILRLTRANYREETAKDALSAFHRHFLLAPEDDSNPATPSHLKISNSLAQVVRDLEIPGDFRTKCAQFLEQQFDRFVDERPVETSFSEAMAALAGSPTDEELAVAIATFLQNATRLKQP